MAFLVGATIAALLFVSLFKGILGLMFKNGYPFWLAHLFGGLGATCIYYFANDGKISIAYMLGAAIWLGVDIWRRRKLGLEPNDPKTESQDSKLAS